MSVVRGCGTRVKGGIYWECSFSEDGGAPLEDFLMDPPIRVPENINIPAIGMTPVVQNGVTHLIDWIGAVHYPNVADFLEEVRYFGVSRRMPSNLPFDRLTKDSRLLLVHGKGWIDNFQEYDVEDSPFECPTGKHAPGDLVEMCVGLWWHDLLNGQELGPIYRSHFDDSQRVVEVKLPSLSYVGRRRPDGVTPEYSPAFIASFPCSRIVVVDGDKAEDKLKTIEVSSLPVAIVED